MVLLVVEEVWENEEIPYTGNVWQEKILVNHTGKSYVLARKILMNKQQSVYMP